MLTFVESIQCGYMNNLPWHMIIENLDQLDYAKERYAPDFSDLFTEMTEAYSIEDYTYLLEYSSTDYGCRYYAGGVLIDTDILSFITAEDCVIPDYGDFSPDAIEGYCFLAAIPKAYLLNDQYPGWLYPDRNNIYQDKDYDFTCNYYVSPELNAIYNDQKYIMRTQEEFENFCNASAEIKNLRGDPVISSLWKIDFERNALLAYFIPMDQKYFTYQYGIIIDGNKITTDLIFNDDAYHGKKNGIYMISAVIPKKYLTEKSYDGWTAPDFPPPVPDQIPEIDRNQYSETALLLTTDDIFLYGAQQIDTSFSGKYVMHGEDSIAYIWDDLGMYQNQEFQDFIEAHEYNFDFDQYPESDENYLFMQYLDADYKLIPYAFVIDGNTAEFLYTEGNYQPGHYCFYAAVPEELIQNFYFPDWH